MWVNRLLYWNVLWLRVIWRCICSRMRNWWLLFWISCNRRVIISSWRRVWMRWWRCWIEGYWSLLCWWWIWSCWRFCCICCCWWRIKMCRTFSCRVSRRSDARAGCWDWWFFVWWLWMRGCSWSSRFKIWRMLLKSCLFNNCGCSVGSRRARANRVDFVVLRWAVCLCWCFGVFVLI